MINRFGDIIHIYCGFSVFYEQGIGFVNIPRLFLR